MTTIKQFVFLYFAVYCISNLAIAQDISLSFPIYPKSIGVDANGFAYLIGGPDNNTIAWVDANNALGHAKTPERLPGDISFEDPSAIAVDAAGNIYVAEFASSKVYKLSPDRSVTELIGSAGDGLGNTLLGASELAVDLEGYVYVAGLDSSNVFRISPNGTIQLVIDSSGDGAGNTLRHISGLTTDSRGNLYVVGYLSDNAFRLSKEGEITVLIDSTGDSEGNSLQGPMAIATDRRDNVFVPGNDSNNVFRISPDGIITEIFDAELAGFEGFSPGEITAGPFGVVFLVGTKANNVIQILAHNEADELLTSQGDFRGNSVANPIGLVTDAIGNLFVSGIVDDQIFQFGSPLYSTEFMSFIDGILLLECVKVLGRQREYYRIGLEQDDNLVRLIYAARLDTQPRCNAVFDPATSLLTGVVEVRWNHSITSVEVVLEHQQDSVFTLNRALFIKDSIFRKWVIKEGSTARLEIPQYIDARSARVFIQDDAQLSGRITIDTQNQDNDFLVFNSIAGDAGFYELRLEWADQVEFITVEVYQPGKQQVSGDYSGTDNTETFTLSFKMSEINGALSGQLVFGFRAENQNSNFLANDAVGTYEKDSGSVFIQWRWSSTIYTFVGIHDGTDNINGSVTDTIGNTWNITLTLNILR